MHPVWINGLVGHAVNLEEAAFMRPIQFAEYASHPTRFSPEVKPRNTSDVAWAKLARFI